VSRCRLRLGIVNVVFFGRAGAGDREWVLIDAGVMGTIGLITGAAEELFGPNPDQPQS